MPINTGYLDPGLSVRIQHHLSIILFVAVVGAISLAAAVGVLMGGLEDAALVYGRAVDQHRQVEQLVAEGGALLETAAGITPRSGTESFGVADRVITQSTATLTDLRRADVLFDPQTLLNARLALDRCRDLANGRSVGVQHPDDLEVFRRSAAQYVSALAEVELSAVAAVSHQGRSVARRRRMIMLLIGAICFAYLALIERVRHWTTRHLIDPMQNLADTARQIMTGKTISPLLEAGHTEELTTLAGMLSSFAETLKTNVRTRTAQVVRQKELLETEVRVRRRAEQELRYSALRDRLTGLCSRDLLMDRIGQCFARARGRDGCRFALLVVDVDRFSEVNDSLGRLIGDQLVIAVADRFRSWLEELAKVIDVESASLARIGGDDFAVLLDGLTTRDDAGAVAERLEEALAEPFHLQGNTLNVSASVGIALAEDGAETAEELMRNADAAMHFAKAGGKGRLVVFRPGMSDEISARDDRAAALRRALDLGHFSVVYQPIVSLETGRICGFEALTRWDDPDRGPVSPVEFIPEAEETGVIVELGRWVLRQACRQLNSWQGELADGRHLSIAVNVSQHQLAHPTFVKEIRQVLRETGIKAADLKLEITESVIMEKPDEVADVLGQLRALGTEIHMDDFGTGYSSLSYLHRLPIDVLKIDRAFMNSLSANTDYADVVHTVVALARTLRMRVTVEGVESEEQLVQVRALGCDFAQGFYFSEPVEPDEARAMLVAKRRWPAAA